ncbi:MAG: Nif3-like dinuclear metal center hexameric protein [Aeromonadales bacterium]|nr:Nif3-like dinuclear metal center hexameric protein [Aeromonadales bacterium]MDY2890999.1 Nif3-like dinuclear metal center hexameric protein [Succinivibrio sp.]
MKAPTIRELERECNEILDSASFKDFAYNGIQVEGSRECRCILTACTASQRAIDSAIKAEADVLLVHHGIMWKGAFQPYSGMVRRRLKALFDSGITLIAYHLPLDASMEYGNNAFLANAIGGGDMDWVAPGDPTSIGMTCTLPRAMSARAVAEKLCRTCGCEVRVSGEDLKVKRIGICSGSGSFMLDNAADFDMLVTGDCAEQAWHEAAESGIALAVMGHDSSEMGGVAALGQHLAEKYGLEFVSDFYDPMQDSGIALPE